MKKGLKIAIIVIAILVIVAVAAFAISKINKDKNPQSDAESETVYMEEEILHIDQKLEYKGLEILNFEVEQLESRACEIRATVRNNTENLIEMQDIAMKLYDKDGNLLNVLGAQIDSVDAGGTTTLYARLRRSSIAEIYKIEIEQN